MGTSNRDLSSTRPTWSRRFSTTWYLLLCQLCFYHAAFAQGYGQYGEDDTRKRFFYKMITGGFGTFIIIFMGLGGMASIFMTRQGDSAKKVPILGIVMLLIAIGTFVYRVMIVAGLMGHEYIEW